MGYPARIFSPVGDGDGAKYIPEIRDGDGEWDNFVVPGMRMFMQYPSGMYPLPSLPST